MTKTESRTIAIYSRVNTDSQTTENQERELREIATRMGWSILKVYRDEGVSGAKSRAERPALRLVGGRYTSPLRYGHGMVGGPPRAQPARPSGIPL